MKNLLKALGIIAWFILFLILMVTIAKHDAEIEKELCDQFGPGYEFREGNRSPDLCVNNNNGEVRYP